MSLQDLTPNEEWWNPPLMPNFVLKSKFYDQDCTYGNLRWVLFKEEIFHQYPEEVRRTMFLYIKWCEDNQHRPKYMLEDTVGIINRIMPYAFKVTPLHFKDNRYHYMYPIESLVGFSFKNKKQTSVPLNINIYITPHTLTQWVKEATEWAQSLLQNTVYNIEEFRDAIYKIECALASENPVARTYVQSWLQDILRKHKQD